jgi:hypothetical protein
LVLSLISKTTDVLGTGAQNNWTNDTYDWKKEIVVVTGGSDGIGAHIVRFLAEKGITVVILDIQEPKFKCKFSIARAFWILSKISSSLIFFYSAINSSLLQV